MNKKVKSLIEWVKLIMEMQNNTENYIVECCPHCNTENEIRWNVEEDGYKTHCSYCGKLMMICSECMSAEDNKTNKCDWCEGLCFRVSERKKYCE